MDLRLVGFFKVTLAILVLGSLFGNLSPGSGGFESSNFHELAVGWTIEMRIVN